MRKRVKPPDLKRSQACALQSALRSMIAVVVKRVEPPAPGLPTDIRFLSYSSALQEMRELDLQVAGDNYQVSSTS